MSESYKEIVRKVDAAFNVGNVEGFLEFCVEDVKWMIIGDKSLEGKDAIRQFMSSMEGKESPKISNRAMIADGDSVAAHGAAMMKEEDKDTAYDYCDIYRFQDDKIVELVSYVIKSSKN